jgi:hypothetical protein
VGRRAVLFCAEMELSSEQLFFHGYDFSLSADYNRCDWDSVIQATGRSEFEDGLIEALKVPLGYYRY